MNEASPTASVPDIDLSRFAHLGDDILPKLDALRETDPLHWSESNHCWIATGHHFVAEGFAGRVPLSARRHELIASYFPDPVERERRIGYLLQIFSRFVINMDAPDHGRLRRLLTTALGRPIAERFRPFVRDCVHHAFADLKSQSEIDFVEQVARRITARTILQVIGLPQNHLARMEYWARIINNGLSGGNPDPELIATTNDVFEEMRDILEAEIAYRKGVDQGDFISLLLGASDGSDRLSRDEVIAQLILILIAGHDTTLNTMALAVAKLAGLTQEREFVREHPDQFEAWIMELMRVVAMSTSMVRIVAEDFDWHARQLRKGQFVFLMIAAANRDPAVFANPQQVDFTRSQQGNMTFAPGPHFCVGHWFAKMIMSEVLPAFINRYEAWELIDERLTFTSATGFRGPVHLRLRLHPRHPAGGKLL